MSSQIEVIFPYMQVIKYLFGRRRPKGPPRVRNVRILSDSFITTAIDESSQTVEWWDVARVVTYKVDCYAYDTIWLAFVRKSDHSEVHIPEDSEGFMDLASALVARFPGVSPEWFFDVMQPPFAENFTILFDSQQKVET